jgi:hypothetical protein
MRDMQVLLLSASNDTRVQLEEICKRHKGWEMLIPPNDCDLNFMFMEASKADALIIDFEVADPIHYFICGAMLGLVNSHTPAVIGLGDQDAILPLFGEASYTLDTMERIEHCLETLAECARVSPQEAMSSWAAGGH